MYTWMEITVCVHGKDIHAWMKHDGLNNTNPLTDENYWWFAIIISVGQMKPYDHPTCSWC